MPPKKHNRDADDDGDALDVNELKEMHRAAIDREAELEARVSEMNDEKVKRTERCCYNFLSEALAGTYSHFPNPNLATLLANFDAWSLRPKLRYCHVSSWSNVMDAFDTGMKSGTKLLEAHPPKTAFVLQVLLLPDASSSDDVAVGEESKYIVTLCRPGVFSTPAAAHIYLERWKRESLWLDVKNMSQPSDVQVERGVSIIDEKVLDEIRKQPWNGKIEDIWIPTSDDPHAALRCSVDMDKMTITSRKDGSVRWFGFGKTALLRLGGI